MSKEIGRAAYFISPHGFGHAARACAVMAAVHASRPDFAFDLFTGVPEWFFRESLAGPFTYHDTLTDVGLAQHSPLEEDLPETMARLGHLLPFEPHRVARLAEQVLARGAAVVVCDIAPLGLAVARAAGLPAVLIENFTWDWIYRGYLDLAPGLERHAAYLEQVFALATCHLQAEPVCVPAAREHVRLAPVSRAPHADRAATRRRLGIPPEVPAILITMGGIPGRFLFLDTLQTAPGVFFVVPGGAQRFETRGNVVLLPHHSSFYHPDLVWACDAVVGKAGYSTVAEAWRSGAPLAYVPRPRFRESAVLAGFIERELSGLAIPPADFESGAWVERVPDLLSRVGPPRQGPSGAEQAAEVILDLMASEA